MLHNTCLLVNLKISMPPQTKLAREASDDVEIKYATAKKQGRVTKQLFHPNDIKPLAQAMSRARALFNELSLPYDSAYRIIPSSTYFDFLEKMNPISADFDQKKTDFLRKYDDIVRKSRLALGGLFNEADYPEAAHLQNTIGLTLESSVVPAVTAFDNLAGITPEAVEELKEQALAGQEEKIKSAMEDLLGRLHVSLNKAKSSLSVKDKVFKNTLISNIHAALGAIDNLNLTNDPDLVKLAAEVRNTLHGITPESIRGDKELRAKTVEDTTELLGKISEFF